VSIAHLKRLRELRIGAIGLVRGGKTPVALVRVSGPAFSVKKDEKPWGWYRYRYPVEILGWYGEDAKRWRDIRCSPPSQGTFQFLDKKSPTRTAIENWNDHVEKAKAGTRP